MNIGQSEQYRPLKVLFHDERGGKTKGGCDKYPKNLAGSRPAEEIKEEEMPIKEEEAATKWGLEKN